MIETTKPDSFLLQSMVWPRSYDAGLPESLCFRASPRAEWEFVAPGGIRTVRGMEPAKPDPPVQQFLDLGTFFGAISLTTWCGPAGLDEITLQVNISGSCKLQLFADNGHEGRSLLWDGQISGVGSEHNISLQGLKDRHGILYPVFEPLYGCPFELHGASYLTSKAPLRAPRLAIIMPTFRREKYVKQNVELIRDHVLKFHADKCRLFVIDNAGTVDLPVSEGVELVRNRNFGGAGGFARGVLCASDESANFTHMLFCDDDVLIEHQSITRLLSLLAFVSDDSVISGGMLRYSDRHVLHERNGNVYNMHIFGNRHKYDLTRTTDLARYDEPGFSTFCGWWFACYPLGAYKDKLLPYPFFVGWDDIEMGRRCNSLELKSISLLGIGVWHEEFEKKDTTWRWFYHTRNGLVTCLLYDRGKGGLKHALREVWKALVTYRYERAEYMIDGLADVIAGSRSISEQAADELHKNLVAREKNKFRDVGRYVVPDRLDEPVYGTRFQKWLAKVSMNGHLLPRFTFKPAREPVDPGWVVEHLRRERQFPIFRCQKVVYYEPTTGKGMLCEVDHARFFRLLTRLLVRWIRLSLTYKSVRTHWRARHGEMTSPAFWTRYLGLHETARPVPITPDTHAGRASVTQPEAPPIF